MISPEAVSQKYKKIPDWATYSPLLLLPSEVRIPLWNYLPHKDRTSLRATCSTFKHEIDTCTGISINLDERLFDKLNIISTLLPSASKLRIWGADRTNDYLSRLLYNARLLTQVIFAGPTDIIHIKKIITRCPNLASITVTQDCRIDRKLIIAFKLRTVKALHLGVEEKVTHKDFPQPPLRMDWAMYHDIITNLTFPCLKTLDIQFILPKEDSTSDTYWTIFSQIIKYLLTHKAVNDLTIRLHKAFGSSKSISSKISGSELLLPLQFSSLEDPLHYLQLKSLTVSTDPECITIWEKILLQQKNLDVLDFLNQDEDWLLFPKIVKNNRRSLRVLKLRRLIPDRPLERPQHRVDLGSFEFDSCPKLEELLLSRFENSTKEVCLKKGDQDLQFLDRPSSKFPELIRFSSLPKSLKKLHVQGFTVKTEDLMLIPERLENLELLELQLLGYNAGAGHEQGESEAFVKDGDGGGGEKLEKVGGGGGGDGAGDRLERGRWEEMMHQDISTLWREEAYYKAIGVDGFGVTPSILKGLLTKLTKLDTLFVEEFENEHTALGKDPGFGREVRKINLIPGDCRLKACGYFGVLMSRKCPISGDSDGDGDGDGGGVRLVPSLGWLGLTGDLWEERFNQYRNQAQANVVQKSKKQRPRNF